MEEAEQKLAYYKEKFRKKEESGRIIISTIKNINWDFQKKKLNYTKKLKNELVDSETLYLVSGNEKKNRVMKGLQGLTFLN